MTCAICLEQIIVEDMCVVKGCEHVYCGTLPLLAVPAALRVLGHTQGVLLCTTYSWDCPAEYSRSLRCCKEGLHSNGLLSAAYLVWRQTWGWMSDSMHARAPQVSASWAGPCTRTPRGARSARRPSARC